MSMSKFVSKALLGSPFEKELGAAMKSQIASAQHMADNMLAPTAFAYAKNKGTSYAGSALSSQKVVEKMHLPIQQQGMFQDRVAFDAHYPAAAKGL